MTADRLLGMIQAHYDNELLFRLAGEIYWDDELSEAEIALTDLVLGRMGRDRPDSVYLPCAGSLRHVVPLLRRGVSRVVAVDLAQRCIDAGLEVYGADIAALPGTLEVHTADIRDTHRFVPDGGFELALMLGNSFGDVTDPDGHRGFITAIAEALAPGGLFLFDYVGDRYNPPEDEEHGSAWEETLLLDHGPKPVIDHRRRRAVPVPEDPELTILEFSCLIEDRGTGGVLDEHGYRKLVMSDDRLRRDFDAASLRVESLGAPVELSGYHRNRVDDRNDLGMMGPADRLYAAVKR